MLDDEYDMRIKEAADHYHPEYDDTAWQKMERLLDEHLPVEKERKRVFFLIPSLLVIGGLLLFIFLYKGENKKPENKIQKSVVTNPSNDLKKITDYSLVENNKKVATIRKKNGIEEKIEISVAKKAEKTEPVSSFVNRQNQDIIFLFKNDLQVKQNAKTKEEVIAKTNNLDKIGQEGNSVSKSAVRENKSNLLAPVEKGNEAGVKKLLITAQDDIPKTEKGYPEDISKKTKKASRGFANNFGISISAGPDISGVRKNEIGKLTVAYGAGLSYAVSKKLNLRTGFYLSKKIYSVGPEGYKIPAGSAGNYEYLENIDANCIVYEIPVKLDYSFGDVKSHNWFVSGGLSSYLMKKENYEYYFKTPAGQIYDKDWSVSNKNKHLFSVLSISGGYQYSFNKQFSIVAEPYINLPLTGIGSGKVKLNSGGILFTIKAKPFLKSH
jgi:hypothetical protein